MNLLHIRAIGGSQHYAFEELCCQLAAIESKQPEVEYFRKGVGADAGVECFIRLPNGKEVGWQAKFFDKFGASQRDQLAKSFDQALEKHPKLQTYMVCLPIDLKDSRSGTGMTELNRWEKWRERKISEAEKLGRRVQIKLLQATDIRERLARSDPFYSGRLAYFFGETSFTSSWFEMQLENTIAALGSRYSPEFHVSLPIREAFFGIGRTSELEEQRDDWRNRIAQAAHEHLDHPALGMDGTSRIAARDASSTLISAMERAVAVYETYPLDNWEQLIERLHRCLQTYINDCWRHIEDATGSDKEVADRRHDARTRVNSLYRYLGLIEDLRESLQEQMWRTANAKATMIAGDAGTGKSHLLGDVATDSLSKGRPAILLMTSLFSQQDPRGQILERLDLRSLPFSTFLGALDAAGEAAGVRALLMIDALNERHGIELWREHLAPLISEVGRFPHVALVVSCRTTYIDALLHQDSPLHHLITRIDHHGFTDKGGRAARDYLARRGIVRPSAPNLSPEFNNPLFLKTCCDALEKDGLTAFPKGVRSITQLLKFYVDASARRIEERMGLDSRQKIVRRAIEAFAGRLVATTSAYLPAATAIELFEDIFPSQGMGNYSLLTQLEHEGVLTVELVYADDTEELEEQVRFTFERISDFRIASFLLQHQPRPISAPLDAGTPLYSLLTSNRLYEFGGILEALAVMLPEELGIELPDIVPDDAARSVWPVTRAFFESLLLRQQTAFTDSTKALIDELSTPGDFRWLRTLIAVATEPENKFNADYLHQRLAPLSMPQRDAAWSIDLADLGLDRDGHLDILLEWALDSGDSHSEHVDNERARLTALVLTWLLATSHRVIRDRATKSLASFLRSRLSLSIYLLNEFGDVDDLYVLERLLAAIYGASLQANSLSDAGGVAERIYAQFFCNRSPPLHFLARDYAKGIIEYADYRGVLSAEVNLRDVRPPYRSEWPIDYVSEADLDRYSVESNGYKIRDEITQSASSEWSGDFAKYVISPAIDDWSAAALADGEPKSSLEYFSSWLDGIVTNGNADALEAASDIVTFCTSVRERELKEELAEDEAEPPLVLGGVKIRLCSPDEDYWKRRRDDDKRYGELEIRLLDRLEPADRYVYQTRIRHYLSGVRYNIHREQTQTFDAPLAQRWVTVRAHTLGWDRDLFGGFDSRIGTGRSRSHKEIERIGKKYQWLALSELLARMSDNLIFSTYEGPRRFEGSWQTYQRDIDPSLLLSNTEDDGWRTHRSCWWSPSSLRLDRVSRDDQSHWLETDQDQLNSASLLDVVQPGGRHWLVLKGFRLHRTSHRSGSHVDSWSRIWCLVVKKQQAQQLIDALGDESLIDPHALPNAPFHDQIFLAEHPWHPALRDDDWVTLDRHNQFQGKVIAPVAAYSASANGRDRSVTDNFTLHVPGRWLMQHLGLHLVDGRNPRYASYDDQVAFQDPSISEPGPSAALADKEKFLAMLGAEDLTAVWVVAGEKGAYGSNERDFVGRRVHSFVYVLTPQGQLECAKQLVRIERPGRRDDIGAATNKGDAKTAMKGRAAGGQVKAAKKAAKGAKPAKAAKGAKPTSAKKAVGGVKVTAVKKADNRVTAVKTAEAAKTLTAKKATQGASANKATKVAKTVKASAGPKAAKAAKGGKANPAKSATGGARVTAAIGAKAMKPRKSR